MGFENINQINRSFYVSGVFQTYSEFDNTHILLSIRDLRDFLFLSENSCSAIEIKLSKVITNKLTIPTIGIGSSVNCDGQVLVIDDLIGLSESKFRFVKKYVNMSKIINSAVKKYKFEVLKKKFPNSNQSFKN